MAYSSTRVIRQALALVLRLAVVLLVAGLCSFLILYRPVLRVAYEGLEGFFTFMVQIGQVWSVVGPAVLSDYGNSLLALCAALVLAFAAGVPAGMLAGSRPTSPAGMLVRFASYLGTMTPAFLLALGIMIFFVLYVLPATGIRFILLSSQSPTFDPRRLLPVALTLAARPLAYVTVVTAAAIREARAADYVRTARAKGVAGLRILTHHILPNAGAALAGALPPMVLFSISSLPIIEFVFNWPGAGQELLYRIVVPSESNAQSASRVGFLLASLGLTYVVATVLAEAVRQALDPRARESDQ